MKVFNEYGSFRLRWDILISILAAISITIIPFQFAFQHETSFAGSIIVYFIDLFFIIGIFINRSTSYNFGGQEIIDSKLIVSRHNKRYLLIDLLSAIPFEIVFFLTNEIYIEGISIILWIRLIRLIRISQLLRIVNRWQRHYLFNPGYLRITKFISLILFFSHLIACGWFLAAFLSKFPKQSWVVLQNINTNDVYTQYLRSIYWTITTMTTIGYGDVVPHLNYEYVFSIVVMLIGASTYAFIIGNIASLLSTIDSQKSRYWNRLDALKVFLKQRGVSMNLNEKVRNYFEYRWEHHRGLNDDLLLKDLPKTIQLEVMQELTKDLLQEVPMFKLCSNQLKNILLLALRLQTFGPSSFISRKGDKGNEIIFISKGVIEIINEKTDHIYTEYTSGDFFGNVSIMLQENRTASIRTKSFCETFILDYNEFIRIKNEYPEFKEIMKRVSEDSSEKTNQLILEGIVI